MLSFDQSSVIELADGKFRLSDRAGNIIRLENLATGESITKHIAELRVLNIADPAKSNIDIHGLDHLSAHQRKEVTMWKEHIDEILTGAHPRLATVRPEYDVALTTQNQRIESKVLELTAHGLQASRTSLFVKIRAYRAQGPAGLLDGRKDKRYAVYGNLSSEVVDAINSVIASQLNASTMPQARLHEKVQKQLLDLYGDKAPALPGRSTMYRVFAHLTAGLYTTGSAKTRRSVAVSSTRTYRKRRQILPGVEVQVDSTKIDLFVRTKNGIERPTLTILMDVGSRSIIASTLRLDAAKGYDHALLLAQALVPYANRPNRDRHRALLMMARPDLNLLDPASKRAAEMERPVIYPRRIQMDNGKDYLSDVFQSACRKFEVTTSLAPIKNGSAKGVVERTFGSINTLLFCTLPGYVGNSPENRGENLDTSNLLDIAMLTEVFDDWVAKVWQTKHHDNLTDFYDPSIMYTPNQWHAASADFSEPARPPLLEDDFIELMPPKDVAVGPYGITLANRHYDSPDITRYRRVPSDRASHGHKWEIRYNPYDVSRIWFRSPKNTWIECPWRDDVILDKPHAGDVHHNLNTGTSNNERTARARAAERNDVARENAELTGTPMPTATLTTTPTPTETDNNAPPTPLPARVTYDLFDE